MKIMKINHNKGFTLIETMVMLAIIGFLTAIVVFNMTSMLSIRAKAAARRLISDMVWAKKLAETTNTKAGVIFYPNTEKYVVYTSTFTTPASDPVNRKPMIRDFSAGDLHNVNIVSASFGGNQYIEFDPIGRNSTGGSVVFAYGNEQYTVWVEDNTGRAYWTKP
jgi:competence protein ComGD